MKITDNRNKPNVVMFNDLNIGDCFEYKGDFYIKMYPIELCDVEEFNYTAFKLDNCRAYNFVYNDSVTKVDMEIIIRNE